MNITKYKLTIGATALCLILAVVGFGQTPKQDDVRELLPNQTLEREMTGAETHRYKFALKKAEFFQVRVEQKGVDVALRLVDASGAELATMDSPNGKEGSETLSLVADKAGSFILELSGFDAKSEKGIYTVKRAGSRAANANDKRRMAVEKTFVEGMTARDTTGQGETAIKKLEESLKGWRELKDDYLITLTAQQIKSLQDAVKKAQANSLYAEAVKLADQETLESLQTAIPKLEESLKLYREIGDNQSVDICLTRLAISSSNLGIKYFVLGEKQKALEYFNQSVLLMSSRKNKSPETIENIEAQIGLIRATYESLCLNYESLGENQKTIECFNKALLFSKTYPDKRGESKILNALANLHSQLGEYQKTLEYLNQSLSLVIEFQDKSLEAEILKDFGMVYFDLGEYLRALDYFNQSLSLDEKLKANKQLEVYKEVRKSLLLLVIGKVYFKLGDKQKASEYYNQALPLLMESQNSLMGISSIYIDFGENQKVLELLNENLALSKKNKDKFGEAVSLFGIGTIYYNLGDKQKALEYLQQSLPLSKTVGNKSLQAITLDWLMLYWNSLKNSRFAVLYGKQSVNLYQELRSNIVSLDKEIQKTYLKSIETTYRRLADILIASGRIAEAEEVLAMLKEEEFFAYLRRDDKVAADLKGRISLSPDEKKAFEDYEKFADDITRTAAEFGALEKKKNDLPLGVSLTAADQQQYDALKQKYDAAIVVFGKFLNDLKVKFSANDVRVAVVESDTQGILKRLNQPRTVIISTIVGEDRLNLIVTTADIQKAHTVNIKAADLNKLVTEFRAAVKDPTVDPRPVGKKLYDTLFPAALQKDLDNIKADTIVWSLDGTLRYVPMAALWDGKGYLVERYTNAVLTLASRDKISATTTDRTKWLALGVGVSKEYQNFPALTAVPQELCSVIRDPKKKEFCKTFGKTGVIGGLLLSDDEFTLANFTNNLGKVPLIHIASHFSLNAGNEIDSYLLLGGGAERRFSLNDLRKTRLDKVELLTLSACNTAMTSGANSSGVEIEGFGALAQFQGAKTVLATLWSVADDSTRDLMTEFYRQLETNPKIGKAEALCNAQIALLNGKYKSAEAVKKRRTDVFDLSGETPTQPPFPKDANAPFAHPYYWSPFILFGNWK